MFLIETALDKFIVFYLCFSLSAAMLSYWWVYRDIRAKINDKDFDNIGVAVVWFLASLIIAPLLTPILLSNTLRDSFVQAFIAGATDA